MPHDRSCQKLHQRQLDGHMVRIETVSDISKDEEMFLKLMCDLCVLYISKPSGHPLQQAIKAMIGPSLAAIQSLANEMRRQEQEDDGESREH